MASMNSYMTVMIAVAIAATLIAPFATATSDNTGTQSVVNESVTADTGSYVDLGGYDINQGSETIYWYNSTSGSNETLSSPSDYEIRYDTGDLKANASGPVSDGDQLYANYTYQATGGTTTALAKLLPVFFVLVILVSLVSKVTDIL